MLKNKRILVTGACGTVGSELISQLLNDAAGPSDVVAIDNNETELFFLEQRWLGDARLHLYLADVRDLSRMDSLAEGIDIVFHAAALKHVILTERAPFEAVQTNIIGVHNVISASVANDVARVVFTSSDKAVNPTSVMGTSKLMGERIMTAANSSQRGRRTIFASTRFGNVLGSRGSVIPIFHQQIRDGGPVTLTSDDMTRFIMTIQQAVRLVIASAELARGGEVFVTKMPAIRIINLAQVMIEELAPRYGRPPESIKLNVVGPKPGEKLYEELMSSEEARRAVEVTDYFAILPAFRGIYRRISYEYEDVVASSIQTPYTSREQVPMEREALRSYLRQNGLLEETTLGPGHPNRRYWPGDEEEPEPCAS